MVEAEVASSQLVQGGQEQQQMKEFETEGKSQPVVNLKGAAKPQSKGDVEQFIPQDWFSGPADRDLGQLTSNPASAH